MTFPAMTNSTKVNGRAKVCKRRFASEASTEQPPAERPASLLCRKYTLSTNCESALFHFWQNCKMCLKVHFWQIALRQIARHPYFHFRKHIFQDLEILLPIITFFFLAFFLYFVVFGKMDNLHCISFWPALRLVKYLLFN